MCYHNCDMIPQQNENNNGTVPRGDSEDLSKKTKTKKFSLKKNMVIIRPVFQTSNFSQAKCLGNQVGAYLKGGSKFYLLSEDDLPGFQFFLERIYPVCLLAELVLLYIDHSLELFNLMVNQRMEFISYY